MKTLITPVMVEAMRRLRFLLFPAAFFFGSLAQAQTVVVAYFTDGATSSTAPAAAITRNNYTAQQITNLATFDFSSNKVLVINEPSNSGYSTALTDQTSTLATFVQNGGLLIFHDRFVNGTPPLPSSLLPGASGITFVRSEAKNIDVTFSSFISNGTYGTLTNTSLDEGNQSEHRYAVRSTLPAGAVVYLSYGSDTSKAVGFAYKFGTGTVYYSTIPLDYYLSGNSPAAFADIYYPNLLAGISQLRAVPEPSVVGLLLSGICGLGLLRKFRAGKQLIRRP